MPRTCAICGWRDASDAIDWDGRVMAACQTCLGDVVDPPSTVSDDEVSIAWRAINHARKNPGLTRSEIANALGVDESNIARNKVAAALSRGVKWGVLRRVDDRRIPRYFATDKAWTQAPTRTRRKVAA